MEIEDINMNSCVSIGAFATIEKARKQLNSFDIMKDRSTGSVSCVSFASCIITSKGAKLKFLQRFNRRGKSAVQNYQEACGFCAVSPFLVEEFHIEIYSFRACNYTNT